MPAQTVDLDIEQGSTFTRDFQWVLSDGVTPRDITGYVLRMQIRSAQKSPAIVSLTSVASAGITITDAVNGRFTIKITDEQTDMFAVASAKYDLEVEFPTGDVKRLMQGSVAIDPNITQIGSEGSIG